MPTIRGFVEAIEIGRAGLATAFLLHEDGSRGAYTVADLDADPERFNERLSKLGLLRDAMDRAEPVEIEFDGAADRGGSIERVRRLTRDALSKPRETRRDVGLVIGVRLEIINAPEAPAEPSDRGTLALLVDGEVRRYVIPVQTPERVTAAAMVTMARDAQASGAALAVDFDAETRVVAALESGGELLGRVPGGEDDHFDGFVESIAHSRVIDMMVVGLTTAPGFHGDGNVVRLDRFDPEKRLLLVIRGAPEYDLLEAALRDKLRVRVTAAGADGKEPEEGKNDVGETRETPAAADRPEVVMVGARTAATAGRHHGDPPNPALVRGVELMAPLCSASQPVWIDVNRRALDVGPDAECAKGLPSSDLTPRTLREIDLPYRAEWIGRACCNHGVYRFELALKCEFTIFVDDRKLCVHRDEGEITRYAHACLDGDHEVRIVLEGWSCRQKFEMKVYRIR